MPTVEETKMARREEADVILNILATIQRRAEVNADLIPCPRCGRYKMKADLHTNATSRNYDGMVCDECGNQEAQEDAGMLPRLEKEDWAFPMAYQRDNGEELTEEEFVAEEEGWDDGRDTEK